ncbi:hypothetical protein SAMN06272775_3849 [Streptomyces sp. 2323.1]|uniref:hypothetical protein n=1 Tax=Streptomyces sp. 2323.1 TaxID=1938841 RepID=UPI000BC0DC83|nr:hypothetical protein SAMN06272775_3849 [Streptomyces sp. 2323.1]
MGEGSGGAAGLVRAGRLPGALVERASRQAVELLNLDAREELAAGTPERAGHGPAGAVPGGAFGPRIPRTGRCPAPRTGVIKNGGKGAYVIHTTYDAVLVKCRAKARLESATGKRLVLMERPDGQQGPGCTGNQSRVTYTLGPGGTLAFASDDDAGGTPRATLTKR